MSVLHMKSFWLHECIKGLSYIDDDGNKHVGTDTWNKYIKCDVVPSGPAESRDFGDGTLKTYSYTIYVYDMHCRDFSVGEKVRYSKKGKMSGEFLVKGFHRYQTYCIMWI